MLGFTYNILSIKMPHPIEHGISKLLLLYRFNEINIIQN